MLIKYLFVNPKKAEPNGYAFDVNVLAEEEYEDSGDDDFDWYNYDGDDENGENNEDGEDSGNNEKIVEFRPLLDEWANDNEVVELIY